MLVGRGCDGAWPVPVWLIITQQQRRSSVMKSERDLETNFIDSMIMKYRFGYSFMIVILWKTMINCKRF